MRMTEVIVGLRELAPELAEEFANLEGSIEEVKNLSIDCSAAHTYNGSRVLILAMASAASSLAYKYEKAKGVLEKLSALERSYTRKFSAEQNGYAPKEKQLELPGI